MKIKASISIGRSHGDQSDAAPVHITLIDEASRIEFFDGNMKLADFASALLGLSRVEIEGELRGMENVGKKRVNESRQIVCPLTTYKRETLSQWLRENAKEEGWIVDTYLGSQGSVKSHPDGQLLNYGVTKFIES